MRPTTLSAPLAALALLLGGTAASARIVADFPPALTLDGTTLVRAGQAHLRVGFIFKVYDAAYYVEDGTSSLASLTNNAARQLDIRYLRSIDRDQFPAFADKALTTYLTEEERAAIAERVDTINAAYRSVEAGDAYTLTYLPVRGTTELALNGEVLVSIPGADFARAYFRIWTDDTNPYRDFRDQLLGLTE